MESLHLQKHTTQGRAEAATILYEIMHRNFPLSPALLLVYFRILYR